MTRAAPAPTTPTSPNHASTAMRPVTRRAMAIWPRLDGPSLARCGDDPRKVAALVARRTSLPVEVILAMLEDRERAENAPLFYFG